MGRQRWDTSLFGPVATRLCYSLVADNVEISCLLLLVGRYRGARRDVKRRKTNYLKTFPPTEPLTDLCMDLLGPLPRTAAGNEHLLVIVDHFSKMTRAIPLQRIDAETIAAAFLDRWVAAHGPPATVLSDNGPQFRSTFFHGVCSLLGIPNRYYTTRA